MTVQALTLTIKHLEILSSGLQSKYLPLYWLQSRLVATHTLKSNPPDTSATSIKFSTVLTTLGKEYSHLCRKASFRGILCKSLIWFEE